MSSGKDRDVPLSPKALETLREYWRWMKLVSGLASVALTRALSSILYQVSATDPLTFAEVALLLALTATAACFVPAAKPAKDRSSRVPAPRMTGLTKAEGVLDGSLAATAKIAASPEGACSIGWHTRGAAARRMFSKVCGDCSGYSTMI
jgi:hypothetical protein